MTSIAPGNQTVDPPRRSQALSVPRWLPRPTLIVLRLLPLIPVLLVTVLLAAALTGDDGAVATLKQNAAGILGNAASRSSRPASDGTTSAVVCVRTTQLPGTNASAQAVINGWATSSARNSSRFTMSTATGCLRSNRRRSAPAPGATSAYLQATRTGLTNATTYPVNLRALNSSGDGAASPLLAVAPRTTPDTPAMPPPFHQVYGPVDSATGRPSPRPTNRTRTARP